MPSNRSGRDREEKRAEIVASARDLFVTSGYSDVTIARIAGDAGVATNTVYWYFTNKDELLVAVLDDVLAASRARYTADSGLADRIAWVVTELKRVGPLVDTVHARRLVSTSVDQWHTDFHRSVDAMTLASLPPGTPDPDATCAIVSFVIEGLLTHDHDDASATAIARTLAARVV